MDNVEFGILGPGGYVHTKSIKRSDIMKCPKIIMLPEHYRDDGSCLCDQSTCEWNYSSCGNLKYGEEIYCHPHLIELGED